jgi:MFS family permease
MMLSIYASRLVSVVPRTHTTLAPRCTGGMVEGDTMTGQVNRSALASASAENLPAGIWALGFVSLFMDISSEMIHGLLPLFLSTALGASTVTIGIIEGIGEATASISKLFSGRLSDRLQRRKPLTVVGYSLGALSKPLFAIAPSAAWVLVARFSDRVGKGIRGAPRDAMVGDLAPPALRGAAYGLRQSLDTVGAFVGPTLAILLMVLLNDDFRSVFWLAVIPGGVAVLILIVAVREPAPTGHAAVRPPLVRWADLRRLGILFWSVVAVGTVLTIARFSEAFLILRVQAAGLPIALAPLALVVMNVVYAAAAYPMGALSDRVDRRLVLAGGFGALIVSDVALAIAPNLWVAMVGVGLWGLHMGMTQGLLAALVVDVAPDTLRGTAFGLFHFVSGIAMLLASLLAGILWHAFGAPATFLAGAAFTTIGLAGGFTIARVGASRGWAARPRL